MKISIGGHAVAFLEWSPGAGKAFDSAFSISGKGAPADPARPWLPATFSLVAASDGRRGYFVTRDHLGPFLNAHEGVPMILHDAAAGLEALALAAPGTDLYRRVDGDLVEDVQILHRLLTLATQGQTDSEPARTTLAALAETHLGVAPAQGRPSPREWSAAGANCRRPGEPFGSIAPADLEALAAEALAVRWLRWRLRSQIQNHLVDSAAGAWGYVSPGWLAKQVRRWGPLTHHIQLKASIVLRDITARGLHIDLGRRGVLLAGLKAVVERERAALLGLGYLPDQPSSIKAMRSILGRIERRTGSELGRTASGDYATSEEALAPLAATEPFARAFLAHRAADQLRATFEKLNRPVVHPSFDVLKVTGRTSSFGELNAQNVPRDPRVRSCVVARPGHWFVSADFKAIELVALGQVCPSQFGLQSAMAAALNAGKDLHAMVAALATGKPPSEITAADRQKAKPVNFGLPGAMGPQGLRDYARASYGVDLDEGEVEVLSEAWFGLFPEMREFLRDETDLRSAVAEVFELTPATYLAHTGHRLFQGRLEGPEEESAPSPILGGMFLKALRVPEPATRAGRPYEAIAIDYFWSKARAGADRLPPFLKDAITARIPSTKLQRAIMDLAGAAPVFTLTGRLRANASFPARHNTVFQGLAADGAKLALWKVWRAGFAIVNFIHDELLVEIPDGPMVEQHVDEIRRLMIAGMRAVIPDVRVDVECVVSRTWSKEPSPMSESTFIAQVLPDGATRAFPAEVAAGRPAS